MARKKATLKSSSLYDVHPGVAMVAKWAADLPEQTGKSLEEWVQVVQRDGPATDKERRDWLKAKHGFGTNAAWWIAERVVKGVRWADGDPEAYLKAAADYVETMYAGPKAPLRPLHDRLIELGRGLGTDVRVCPCQTIVPFYRKHVFAQIKPTTRTRIDLGLSLRGVDAAGRLLSTGGEAKGDRITHRIAVSALEDIDAFVERWLRTAFDRAA
jgi:Domain of unknown function (DUF5655)/Domain of unknown function (DUF4287)